MSARPSAAPSTNSTRQLVDTLLANCLRQEGSRLFLDLHMYELTRQQILAALSKVFVVERNPQNPWQLTLSPSPANGEGGEQVSIKDLENLLLGVFHSQCLPETTLGDETQSHAGGGLEALQQVIMDAKRDQVSYAAHEIYPANRRYPERIFCGPHGKKLIRISLKEVKFMDQETQNALIEYLQKALNFSVWALLRKHGLKKGISLFKMHHDLKKSELDRQALEGVEFLAAGGLDDHTLPERLFIFFPHYFPMEIVEEITRFFEHLMQEKISQISGQTEGAL